MNQSLMTVAAVIVGALLVATQTFFMVDQTQQAIVLQLGQPVGSDSDMIKGPGLHVKIPLIQDVRYFDRRVLPVDPDPEQVVISSYQVQRYDAKSAEAAEEGAAPKIENVSGEPIIVDTFARYRIVDPLQFMQTLGTTINAASRLKNILNDATRAELGRTTLQELLSAERTTIMSEIRERVNRKIEQDKLGIEIVDVRIVRADLTPDLRTSTVRRMISELTERATETRANGEQRALEIRSTAEKERSVILAEAERDAQIVKGEGDKEAIKTYASAFNKDKDFYAFIRSLEAYRNTLGNQETQMILSPDSSFLRYFGNKPSSSSVPATP
ncbi:MAG: protease modulator HflC [Alphaproteobacteria bacterium]|nr:protease modulator HflC [Alphaproteobacteria bacterium]